MEENKCLSCDNILDPIHHYPFKDKYICSNCLWLPENALIYFFLKGKDELRDHDIYDKIDVDV